MFIVLGLSPPKKGKTKKIKKIYNDLTITQGPTFSFGTSEFPKFAL